MSKIIFKLVTGFTFLFFSLCTLATADNSAAERELAYLRSELIVQNLSPEGWTKKELVSVSSEECPNNDKQSIRFQEKKVQHFNADGLRSRSHRSMRMATFHGERC